MRTELRLLPGIALGCVEVAYKYFCDRPSELGGVSIIKLLKFADTNLVDFLGILDRRMRMWNSLFKLIFRQIEGRGDLGGRGDQ